MDVEARIGEYLKTVKRPAPGGAAATEVAQRAESAFTELGIPWSRDPDGDWRIASDVGEVHAGLDEKEEVLTFSQILGPMPDNPKKAWPFLLGLLKMNLATTGACYAVMEPEGNRPPLLVIIGRIAARKLDPEEVALTLSSVFAMSHVFDSK